MGHDPVWGQIGNQTVRQRLFDDGVPHLRAQLTCGTVRLVLLNGQQVISQVRATGLAELTETDAVPLGRSSCRLVVGHGTGVRWIGWSTNLQSSWGVSAGFKAELARRVAALTAGPGGEVAARTITTVDLDDGGHLPRGLRVTGKDDLVDVLAEWLARSTAATLGDVGEYGGRAWLHVEVGGREVVLDADTRRTAIETFVGAAAREPHRAWRVIANARGRVNKVLPNPDAEPLPGWYAYLVRPLSRPGPL